MKNLAILIIGVLVFMACKKDRVCSCTITTTGTTETTTSSILVPVDTTIITPLFTTNTNKATFKDVSKRKAKFNCFDRSENIDESTNNNIPGFINVTTRNKGTRSYSCDLE